MDFEFHLLETITDNFSDEHKVGSGEYGVVYKGVYDGKEIAVKRLYPLQGLDDEAFVNEYRNLGKVRHQNVVRFIGYCSEFVRSYTVYDREVGPDVSLPQDGAMERLLCFEYIQGGSLDDHISDESCDLDWPTCYKVIKGTCEGLNHLHNAEERPIFHLDLKPANILLDKKMTAKISDLGLSRISASTEIRDVSGLDCEPINLLCVCCFVCDFVRGFIHGCVDGFIRGFVRGFLEAQQRNGLGTQETEIQEGKHEHMPPEYIHDGTVSKKFDVFSFGVLIIKMMAGNTGYSRCCKMSGDDFTELVTAKWNERLQGTSRHLDISLVQTCVRVALRCVEADLHRRPSINEIISTLKSKEAEIKQMSMSSDPSKDLLTRKKVIHEGYNMLECIVGGRQKPSNLKLQFLESITGNFSDEQKIGSGGCGVVYKGNLRNGTIAVKRLLNIRTIDSRMFYQEVKTMMKVDHKNVVRFLGYCSNTEEYALEIKGEFNMAEDRERLLCFEYISNGSLENYLADELRGLTWKTRYQIIRGICDGLDHLHREKHIIHMDLKPANILLDNNMVPKITDFGLSRFDDRSHTMSTDRLLSLGYCAPEYITHGKISAKSDIYSLGVIILALLTGSKVKPNITEVHRRWKHRWTKSAKDAKLESVQDAKLESAQDAKLGHRQVATCLDLAQRCTHMDPADRPDIGDIISDLNTMDSSDVHIINASECLELEDMLGIEPLEIHLPLELNKQISCSIELTNDTDDHFAFRISKTSLRPYSIEANKGILPPQSKCSVTITLQALEKALQDNPCRDEFSVQSTRVNGSLTAMDIDGGIFKEEAGKVVDTVDLTVILSEALPSGGC